MKFKLNLTLRLLLGFGIAAFLLIISNVSLFLTFKSNQTDSEKVNTINQTSIHQFQQLLFIVSQSRILVKNWVGIDKRENSEDKQNLIEIYEKKYPQTKQVLQTTSKFWSKDEKINFDYICFQIDTLFEKQQNILKKLKKSSDYNSNDVIAEAALMLDDNGELDLYSKKIFYDLNQQINQQQNLLEQKIKIINEDSSDFQQLTIVIIGICLIIILITMFFCTRAVTIPIRNLKNFLLLMGRGIIPKEQIKENSDDLGEIKEALNKLTKGLRRKTEFALEIGKKNYNSQYKPLSDYDDLGNALIAMRENLKKADQEELKRVNEDQQRNWFSRGIALFSEILRIRDEDLQEVSAKVISELVRYVNAVQGGIYIANDKGSLDLVAAYAYQRRKFVNHSIQAGEGLAGACYLEKETVYLTDIPDSYLTITSGLGEANPKNILIIPLKVNEEIFGVLELASFALFSDSERSFVEKVGESVASTIAYMKVNIRTSLLLKDSQEKSEQLAQQEEQMRQTIEKMRETQTETEKKMRVFTEELNLISAAIYRIECDIDGTIMKVNQNFLDVLEVSIDELIGRPIKEISSDESSKNFQTLWDSVCAGKREYLTLRWLTFTLKDVQLLMTLIPVFDSEGLHLKKIIAISNYAKDLSIKY